MIPEQVYPGLRPFRRDESILFFGRQEHVDELLGRLEETSFLAVVGLSGSGKSSLVLAGLVPALERGHLGGAGATWQIVEMRPGSDPLGALAAALGHEALGESPGRAPRLRSGRLGLVDAASAGRKPGANLLLVVDQFEELFRFQRDFENKSHEAAEFVRLLLAASSDYDARLYVVITMRSDYLGECARFPGLAEALNGSQYLDAAPDQGTAAGGHGGTGGSAGRDRRARSGSNRCWTRLPRIATNSPSCSTCCGRCGTAKVAAPRSGKLISKLSVV